MVTEANGNKTKTVAGQKMQKYVLNNYLHNLHQKFCMENPEIQISRSTFSKLHPPHVRKADFGNTKTCLCSRHQNFALKLKSPEEYRCTEQRQSRCVCQAAAGGHCGAAMARWQQTHPHPLLAVEEGTRQPQIRMEGSPVWGSQSGVPGVVERWTSAVCSPHCSIQNQWQEVKKLRENMPQEDVLIWMDFAENYTRAQVDQIQSGYWNAEAITLHIMVVYFPKGMPEHQSTVAVSGELSHSATTVYAVLQKLIPKVEDIFPEVKCIHYLTHSPTSLYRNRTIFQLVAWHEEDFGVKARWDYLEAGHGKGPCNGLGASVKHSARNAVTQGRAMIQSAEDFFAWSQQISGSAVQDIYLSKDDCRMAGELYRREVHGWHRWWVPCRCT